MWGHLDRMAIVARALRHARGLAERERWPPERRAARRRERLNELVAYARARSPYWAQAAKDYDPDAGVASLPVLDKATMMDRFDDLVTDRRLRRDPLLEHVERLRGDELHLGRYRAMTTSGSSGRKGLFVYDDAGWTTIGAQFLYFSAIVGTRPRLPRLRIAMLGGGSASHMSRRGTQTLDVGLHRMLALPVTSPMPELVAALNRFGPDVLNVYPSMGVLLAEEQLAGRLRLNLRTISTSSELRTPEAAARIEEAFGIAPYDLYATTEGLWAGECEHHDGLHLFEDDVIAENVDEACRPVPNGEQGARVLVTNLANRVQPIIRLEVGDAMTLTSATCACGRTSQRIERVAGRADDVVWLDRVAVHPMQFSVIARDRDVVEFQVVQEGQRLVVHLVARGSGVEERVSARLRECLAAIGVRDAAIEIRRREALERSAGGKLQIVVAEGRQVASV